MAQAALQVSRLVPIDRDLDVVALKNVPKAAGVEIADHARNYGPC